MIHKLISHIFMILVNSTISLYTEAGIASIIVNMQCISAGFDLGASILESLGLHGSPKMESPGGNVESQTWGS